MACFVVHAGLIQVLDETCEVPDSDIRRTSHTSLPQHEITPVVPIDDIAPMLMDPPYPIYKFLAQQYKLHGTQPSAICRHNAMVCRRRSLNLWFQGCTGVVTWLDDSALGRGSRRMHRATTHVDGFIKFV
jgi:hypothetical protein